MKVLHLFSNWKVTGPAEPVMLLVRALVAEGIDAALALGRAPDGSEGQCAAHARALGLEPLMDWGLSKHFRSFRSARQDAAGIRRYLDAHRVDLVHCHLPNDHHIGGAAARAADRRIPVVRSIYDAGLVKRTLRARLLLPRLTDALVTFSHAAHQANRAFFRVPEGCAILIDGLVDLERFVPRPPSPAFAARVGLVPGRFVLGIITRVQARRRFDLILEAVRRARARVGDFTFLVVGRGTRLDAVLTRPARALGLHDIVRATGYLTGDAYLDALAAMDAKIFLGGGTDETARAVREALAMGTPVIVGDTGMLPELVRHGETGLVAPLDPDALAAAIVTLAQDPALRARMRSAARAAAVERFAPARQAGAIAALYHTLAESCGP